MLVVWLLTFGADPTLSQEPPPPAEAPILTSERERLELRKLALKVDALKADRAWASWLRMAELLVPVAVVALGGFATFVVNRRLSAMNREAERFSALVEARAEAYAEAFTILSPTALFFPAARDPGRSAASPQLTKDDCVQMGRRLASWYFGEGGLLMSNAARDAYFALVECLRRAAISSQDLAVLPVGRHHECISMNLVNAYRKQLAARKEPGDSKWSGKWRRLFRKRKEPGKWNRLFRKLERKEPVAASDLDGWEFGAPADTSLAEQSRDFILIQQLASRFRTALTDDIGSRKPPGA